jgi:uncharacterized protein YbjT (DUF2867 family)
MILLTGATGTCGRKLVDVLLARRVPIRAMSRAPQKADWFGREGLDVVRADLSVPSELAVAMEGVDTAFLLSPQHPDLAVLQANAIDVARAAGVRRIVKLSAGPGIVGAESPSFVGRQHWAAERKVVESGLAYTIIRPSYYLQNLLALAPSIRQGLLPLPFGTQRIAMIDVRDIAAVAANILTDGAEHDGQTSEHDGQTYVLTGPESLASADIAEQLAHVARRQVRYTDPPIDEAVDALRQRGAPPYLQQHMREVWTLFKQGAGVAVTNTVRDITGQPARTIQAFLRDHADAFQADRGSTTDDIAHQRAQRR